MPHTPPPIPVQICDSFAAAPGSTIEWITPSTCTVNAIPGSPWPFTLPAPIALPLPSTRQVGIAALPHGTYPFQPTCCPKPVTVTIS